MKYHGLVNHNNFIVKLNFIILYATIKILNFIFVIFIILIMRKFVSFIFLFYFIFDQVKMFMLTLQHGFHTGLESGPRKNELVLF